MRVSVYEFVILYAQKNVHEVRRNTSAARHNLYSRNGVQNKRSLVRIIML
jgi:hypothetical protein